MVNQKEIQQIAQKLYIQPHTIDKDWVLGHFLNAMFDFEDVKKNFVFKGGTCLKKCYFEDYRFSEDLDFTLLKSEFIVDKTFMQMIIAKAETYSGAKFHLKEIKSQLHNDIPQGYEVIVLFWGADHKINQKSLSPNRWQTKIKLDISFSEKVILKPKIKNISHSYSDFEIIKNQIPVYPINEIISEKLRALIQRNRPRDIYDLYYLSSFIKLEQYEKINKLLKEKAEHKKVVYKNNKRAWENSLEYHLPKGKLVNYDIAYEKVEKFVELILKYN